MRCVMNHVGKIKKRWEKKAKTQQSSHEINPFSSNQGRGDVIHLLHFHFSGVPQLQECRLLCLIHMTHTWCHWGAGFAFTYRAVPESHFRSIRLGLRVDLMSPPAVCTLRPEASALVLLFASLPFRPEPLKTPDLLWFSTSMFFLGVVSALGHQDWTLEGGGECVQLCVFMCVVFPSAIYGFFLPLSTLISQSALGLKN